MLDRMKLKTKIALIVIAALLGLLSLTVFSAFKMKTDLINGRKEVIQSILESTHATLAGYQALAAAGTMTEEDAKKAAAQAISLIRYGGKDGKSEYVYSFTTEGVGVYHPVKERIGQNMLDKIKPQMHIVETALEAMRQLGIEPQIIPVRGGTDGSQLSYRGLLTPNIFTGGHNAHGKHEFISVQSMEKAVEVILKITELYAAK